jgi:hypothetical protein
MANKGAISANIRLVEIDDDNYKTLESLTIAYHLETFLSRCSKSITNKTVKEYLKRYLSDLNSTKADDPQFDYSAEMEGVKYTLGLKGSTVKWLVDHGVNSVDDLLGFSRGAMSTFSTPSRYMRDIDSELDAVGLALRDNPTCLGTHLEHPIETLGLSEASLTKLKRQCIYNTTQIISSGYTRIIGAGKVDSELRKELNRGLSSKDLAQYITFSGLYKAIYINPPDEFNLREHCITLRIISILSIVGYYEVSKLITLTKNQVRIIFMNYAAAMGEAPALAESDLKAVVNALARRGLVLHKSKMTAEAERHRRWILALTPQVPTHGKVK